MQIFKGIIHNTSRSNQTVAAAYFIFLFAFLTNLSAHNVRGKSPPPSPLILYIEQAI